MEAYVGGKSLAPDAALLASGQDVLVLIEREELSREAKTLGLSDVLRLPVSDRMSSRFERREDHERLLLYVPQVHEALDAPPSFLGIYYTQHWMVWVYDDELAAAQQMRKRLSTGETLSPTQALYALLGELTARDEALLEDTEESIASLEDAIVEGEQIQFTTHISALRRQLLLQRRFYESLQDALEDLEENPHGYWSADQLAHFHLLTGRVERLFRAILHLRDYVTQVREAYQSQMDISMNRTMKLFTVLTAIFSPLTLLVGWYGMNLMMPEYDWPFAYPLVILVTLLTVVISIVIFRRRGWF